MLALTLVVFDRLAIRRGFMDFLVSGKDDFDNIFKDLFKLFDSDFVRCSNVCGVHCNRVCGVLIRRMDNLPREIITEE